jgi:hypothetical protein
MSDASALKAETRVQAFSRRENTLRVLVGPFGKHDADDDHDGHVRDDCNQMLNTLR